MYATISAIATVFGGGTIGVVIGVIMCSGIVVFGT